MMHRRVFVSGSLLFIAVLAGCGDKVVVDRTAENPHFSHLSGVAEIYLKCRQMSRGEPVDEAKLKQFGNSDMASLTLKRFGVETAEELLVSNRDNAPLVLMLKKGKMRVDGVRVIAHEQQGKDGMRMVALESGGAMLLTEEEFNAAKK